MYLFFYMALGLNDFDGGKIHYLGHWKGWALKISTFLGPEMTMSEASAIRAQNFRAKKSFDF